MSRRSTKPKGWRKIVVDNIEYWWRTNHVRRASDRKSLNVWDALIEINKNVKYFDPNAHYSWTPGVIAELIRHTVKNTNANRK